MDRQDATRSTCRSPSAAFRCSPRTASGWKTPSTARPSPSRPRTARRSTSQLDLTFFAGFDQVTTPAVPDSNDEAKVFGLAGFADARKGYVELGYGYIDADDSDLSYHNVTAAFTKRYGGRVANSVRLIGNFGQKGAGEDGRRACWSWWRTRSSRGAGECHPSPVNLVPYFNLFAGFDTPQPLARAADSGGVLKNTGINFESDGLTGYPTLDASAHESYGGALGVEYLFNLDRQIVVEGAVVERMGDSVLGSQYALGAPLSAPDLQRLDRAPRRHARLAGGAEERLRGALEIRRKL